MAPIKIGFVIITNGNNTSKPMTLAFDKSDSIFYPPTFESLSRLNEWYHCSILLEF